MKQNNVQLNVFLRTMIEQARYFWRSINEMNEWTRIIERILSHNWKTIENIYCIDCFWMNLFQIVSVVNFSVEIFFNQIIPEKKRCRRKTNVWRNIPCYCGPVCLWQLVVSLGLGWGQMKGCNPSMAVNIGGAVMSLAMLAIYISHRFSHVSVLQ